MLPEIEPWTFEQHVGEAVIIPAGCPYQIRNSKVSFASIYLFFLYLFLFVLFRESLLMFELFCIGYSLLLSIICTCNILCNFNYYYVQCCVHVVLEFVSPENATECIQLIDEARLLPQDHQAKVDHLQVSY